MNGDQRLRRVGQRQHAEGECRGNRQDFHPTQSRTNGNDMVV